MYCRRSDLDGKEWRRSKYGEDVACTCSLQNRSSFVYFGSTYFWQPILAVTLQHAVDDAVESETDLKLRPA